MKYITLYSSILVLLSLALAQGPQPCYNQADPDAYVVRLNRRVVAVLINDSGLPNYCACADNSCWATSSSDCRPTSDERLDPCPVGDPTSRTG
jgi:hypothetical protein